MRSDWFIGVAVLMRTSGPVGGVKLRYLALISAKSALPNKINYSSRGEFIMRMPEDTPCILGRDIIRSLGIGPLNIPYGFPGEFNVTREPNDILDELSTLAKIKLEDQDPGFQDQIQKLLLENAALDSSTPCVFPKGGYKLKLKPGSNPVFRRQYPLNTTKQDAVDETVGKWITLMLALSNHLQYEVDHVDVDGAYLNADLKEDIVMRIPYPMAEWAGSEFVRLRKAIYGLRQSGYEWNQCLTQHLTHKGYRQSEGDNCLFIGNAEGKPAFIMVYVDDLVLMTPCHKSMKKMKNDISERFSVKDLGELSHILGIRVHWDRSEDVITLDQTTAKSVTSALREATCISAIKSDKVSEDVEGRAYRIIINSLDKKVAAMLKLDGTAHEIWEQLKKRYGTLLPRDELKLKSKIQAYKTSDANSLKEYVAQKCMLINEFIDRGGILDDSTRCAYLLDGLNGCAEGSPFNSPLITVPKRDLQGTKTGVRVCIDPRPINDLLEDDSFIVPLVNEVFSKTASSRFFSTIDLREAYTQITLNEESKI